MNVRPFQPSDLPALLEIHERAAYGFPFPENIAEYEVVTDDADAPIMAAGAKLMPEVTLICAPGGTVHPITKLKAISLLHDAVRDKLVAKGFHEALASVPPELERNYARHLKRLFHWEESWKTFRIRDWQKKEGS